MISTGGDALREAVTLYASEAQMRQVHGHWNRLAQLASIYLPQDEELWHTVEAIADIMFRSWPIPSVTETPDGGRLPGIHGIARELIITAQISIGRLLCETRGHEGQRPCEFCWMQLDACVEEARKKALAPPLIKQEAETPQRCNQNVARWFSPCHLPSDHDGPHEEAPVISQNCVAIKQVGPSNLERATKWIESRSRHVPIQNPFGKAYTKDAFSLAEQFDAACNSVASSDALQETVQKLQRYSIACSGLVVNGVEDMEITENADGQYLFRPDVLAALSAKEKS